MKDYVVRLHTKIKWKNELSKVLDMSIAGGDWYDQFCRTSPMLYPLKKGLRFYFNMFGVWLPAL